MATTDQSNGALGFWISILESKVIFFFFIICFGLPIHLPFDGLLIGRLFLLSNFGSIFFRAFLNRDVEDIGVNDDLLIALRFFGICVDEMGAGVVVIPVPDKLVGRVSGPSDSLKRDDE